MNPGKFVRDVEVDTDIDEVPAITTSDRLRIEEEHRGAHASKNPTWVGFATPLKMLAGHGVEAAAEEAVRPSARESPRIWSAREIMESKDDTPLEKEEVQSVRGTPTGVLCEQVVPLLRYLDRKATKYGDPRQGGSYVELTDSNVEQIQIRNLADELVRKTQALEQSEAARRVDEELLGRLQSQCKEMRAQRAAAELLLAEVEGHNRRAADRTWEELVARVGRCLRDYAHWEVATRERVTLRELEMRATALMAGDRRSRQRVAKRLEAFMSMSRDVVANLKVEVTEVLRRLRLRRRADEWTGRE
ncbi:hypothetical protein AXG93_1976s1560 [Marchantia polymorpha subsp. ruderalis]|uniref:Uncharacterized protein n=1 Tax=Marchantia polymorpha subsp. ruderalis TaxID=1480154 RepID=A0A176VDL4_MARPO|nr:hypothetical protein AXG93_1976s1560 [Marchantia polymorpha subsp. ruderalis]